MKTPNSALITAVPLAAALAAPAILAQSGADQPPVAKKLPHVTDIHGSKLEDDYFWLREKTNPDVTAYLEAENAYTEERDEADQGASGDALRRDARTHQADRPQRAVAHRRLSSITRARKKASSIPTCAGKQGQHDAGRKKSCSISTRSPRGTSFSASAATPSATMRNWLAYSVDTTGYRQYTLHVKDLRTGQLSTERIERTRSVVWATDNKTLFYSTEDAVSKRGDKVFRHVVGTDGQRPDLRGEGRAVRRRRQRDRSTRRSSSSPPDAKTSNEIRYVPADTPTAAPKLILARQDGHEYDVDHYNGEFYITTNKGAKNFKVVKAPIADPSEKNWKPFIDHKPGLRIGGLTFFRQPPGRVRA